MGAGKGCVCVMTRNWIRFSFFFFFLKEMDAKDDRHHAQPQTGHLHHPEVTEQEKVREERS